MFIWSRRKVNVAPKPFLLGLEGNGPALNVSYALEPMEAPAGANVARPDGYIHSIAPGKVVLSPISRGVIQIHRFQVTFKYESLSGRKYETKLVLDSLVLTPPFQFIRS